MPALPAYVYGDPTGGMLFRMLMPLLAVIWGTWLIVAHRIRNGVQSVIKKLRGEKPNDQSTITSGNES